MTKNDDVILEFLEEFDLALSPREIHYNLDTRKGIEISYSTINRRLKKLLLAELVQKEYPKGGLYSITDKGRAYLAGEIDADELEESNNEGE